MNDALVIMRKPQKSLAKAAEPIVVLDAIATAGPEAVNRFIEFSAQIRDCNTREAYGRACSSFSTGCMRTALTIAGLFSRCMSRVGLRPAVRVLLDWLVTGGGWNLEFLAQHGD